MRKYYPEQCTTPFAGFNFYMALVQTHHLLYDGESQTNAALAQRHKGIKYPFPIRGSDTRTIVSHFDDNTLRFPACSYTYPAPGLEDLDCIEDQVKQHLEYLFRITFNERRLGPQVLLKLYPTFVRLHSQKFQCLSHDGMQITLAKIRRLGTGTFDQGR